MYSCKTRRKKCVQLDYQLNHIGAGFDIGRAGHHCHDTCAHSSLVWGGHNEQCPHICGEAGVHLFVLLFTALAQRPYCPRQIIFVHTWKHKHGLRAWSKAPEGNLQNRCMWSRVDKLYIQKIVMYKSTVSRHRWGWAGVCVALSENIVTLLNAITPCCPVPMLHCYNAGCILS